MISRNLSTLEGFYNASGGMVQLGMKVKKTNRIPEILDILINNVFSLRLKTINSKMISTFDVKTSKNSFREQTHIYSIPSNLDLIESCKFMYTNHSKPFNEVLGTIGYNNDDIIVLNMSHLVGDGKYLNFIVDYLVSKLTNTKSRFESPDSMKNLNELILSDKYQLPINMEAIFKDQIDSSKIILPHIFVDEGFSHIKPRTKVYKNYNAESCEFISFKFPINEFRCFNKQTNKCSGLSECIWSSFILSAAAFNENGNDKIDNIFGPGTNSVPGVTNCVDMRPYLKNRSMINWLAANLYSSVTISAPYSKDDTSLTTSNESLQHFEKRLRIDFLNKIQSGYHFAFLNTLTPPEPGMNVPGIGLEVSSIGPFYLSKKGESKDSIFSDIFVKSSVSDANCDPLFSFSSFSTINEIEGIKTFSSNMRYKSSIFSTKEANEVGKGTEFALKNLSQTMTVREAIESIKQFQKTL